jgi:hypothetical protein
VCVPDSSLITLSRGGGTVIDDQGNGTFADSLARKAHAQTSKETLLFRARA